MFIELADYLRCPAEHDFMPCVVVPTEMDGRVVVTGIIGCPVCRREYEISEGRALIGTPPAGSFNQEIDPETVRALLGLESPGGYVVLAGDAVRLEPELAAGMKAGFVGVNAPGDMSGSETLSLLDTDGPIPLNQRTVRGVVLDAGHATANWLSEAARVVLPGQRVVVATEEVPDTEILEELAAGHGFWVGRRV